MSVRAEVHPRIVAAPNNGSERMRLDHLQYHLNRRQLLGGAAKLGAAGAAATALGGGVFSGAAGRDDDGPLRVPERLTGRSRRLRRNRRQLRSENRRVRERRADRFVRLAGRGSAE